MRTRKYWIFDYETILNTFIAVFEDLNTSERYTFIIGKHHNDIHKLIKFFEENIKYGDWHLGYNNLAFDSQITERLLDFKEGFKTRTGEEIAYDLYKYAGYIIEKSNNKEFLDYPEFKLNIRNVDIFKLNYWNSAVKRSSLKWIQFAMDWHNVEEMSHDFNQRIETEENLVEVVNYCINDVTSTKAIYNFKDRKGERIMISQINLRGKLSKEFDLRLHSAAEPKIVKDVFLHFLSKKLKIDKKILRDKRTYRDKVYVKELILPYIKFHHEEFNDVLKWFQELVLDTAIIEASEEEQKKKGPKYVLDAFGIKSVYALGGLHGATKPGVYKSEKGKVIKTVDVDIFGVLTPLIDWNS
jgi:hypothetical protein